MKDNHAVRERLQRLMARVENQDIADDASPDYMTGYYDALMWVLEEDASD